MLQKYYSAYAKNKRNAKKKNSLKAYFVKEGVSESISEKSDPPLGLDLKVTIVSAVYNAEEDLEQFVVSIINQSLGFKKNIELLLIDDGSSDNTAACCKKWVDKYPKNIFYYFKENGGPASARNFGLEKARGDWVSFIDPDDFVNKNYFYNISEFVRQIEEKSIDVPDLFSLNMVVFKQDKNVVDDSHPLSYKFKKGLRLVDIKNDPVNGLQLSASSSLMRMSIIKNNNLKFKDIRPGFEDAFFVNEYLMHGNMKVGIIPNSKYFYRKKENGSSLLSTAWQKKEKFKEQISHGNLQLLELSKRVFGDVPEWIQCTVFYDLIWHFKYLLNQGQRVSFLEEDERKEYACLLRKCFGYIEPKIVSGFNIAGNNTLFKAGLMSKYYKDFFYNHVVEAISCEEKRGLVQFRYISALPSIDVQAYVDGENVELKYKKVKTSTFLDSSFVNEHYFWLKVNSFSSIRFESPSLGRLESRIGRNENNIVKNNVYGREIFNYYKVGFVNPKKMEISKKSYRYLAKTDFFSKKFKNAWIFMDRDTQADDNAEHLYRYILDNKNINCWFVLRKSSHDWNRLKAEGFNLLEFGSVEHKIALLCAKFFLSSHADKFLLDLMPEKYYKDILKFEYIFLQHGVTKDDISTWLNTKNIKIFVTSTKDEYHSIVNDGSNYKFSEKEVKLTGFPRHDALYRKSQLASVEKRILIMPTWRKGLVGKNKVNTNDREYNEEFVSTNYFLQWQLFLRSKTIKYLSEKGYDIIFFPHVNVEPYVESFDCSHVRVLKHTDVSSIQDLFVSSCAMVTDYSSVAFEMAFVSKPVFYFQFDEKTIYTGEHLYSKGYFDYREHGFGPVVNCLDEIEKCLMLSEEKEFRLERKYLKRMEKAFPYKKGESCEKVYQAIIERQ